MQNKIQTTFSIKDLENLSGIKAHTIRIWEKRYKLLSPERSDTNIRLYNPENLRRLLNITLLNSHGVKISKIAELSDSEMNVQVNEVIAKQNTYGHAHNNLKLAMLQFDEHQFDNVYNQLSTRLTFREIFTSVFIGLLEEIGFLWQTKTITPAHENFISTIIKHKLLLNIEKTQPMVSSNETTFVLFLPDNEIHELGLLFIYYELKLRGYHTIYLGQSVPIENLGELQKIYPRIEFISQFTVAPRIEDLSSYLKSFLEDILKPHTDHLHILGRNTVDLETENPFITVHEKLTDLVDSL